MAGGDCADRYARPRPPPVLRLEREVYGDVGVCGYTTFQEADALVGFLGLRPGSRLLDLGSGRGWLARRLREVTGCRPVAADVPVDALLEAKRTLDAGRGVPAHVVRADGAALPFRDGAFDAVVHADVFC